MYPASTTKIMTAILTLENANLNDVVTVPYDAIRTIPAGYSIAALQTDEQLTVNQLLQVMMVYSANDAANVLAFHISGSLENFANLMNQKVSELGLTDTHFTNPSGIHDPEHYSSAPGTSDLPVRIQESSAASACFPTRLHFQDFWDPGSDCLAYYPFLSSFMLC